ncbi:MAG: DUF2630 family protein [Acidimicrobiales bacterium]
MDDEQILGTIEKLVDEEHELRRRGEGIDPARLRRLEETLDQCWDLLRQRRARREYGENPEDAAVRPPSTVEGYRQ